MPAYAAAGVDLIDRALTLLEGATSTASALNKMKKIKGIDLGHAAWTEYEAEDLNDAVAYHGNDIESVAKEVKSKTLQEIVNRYYISIGCVARWISAFVRH